MNELAATILSRGFVEDATGQHVPLHSHTSLKQLEFLSSNVRSINAVNTLEIGLAFGISTLCIVDTIKETPNARHYAIDPFQNTASWQGIGLLNLERAGLRDLVFFLDEFAQTALPQLMVKAVQIDFAYVDAGKRMDDILIFAYYLARLVRVGGLIAFDDLTFPGVRKALRYILQQDHFRLKASFEARRLTLPWRLASSIAKRTPFGQRLLAAELVLPDTKLGVSANCIVIEKIAEPDNDWRWHPVF